MGLGCALRGRIDCDDAACIFPDCRDPEPRTVTVDPNARYVVFTRPQLARLQDPKNGFSCLLDRRREYRIVAEHHLLASQTFYLVDAGPVGLAACVVPQGQVWKIVGQHD